MAEKKKRLIVVLGMHRSGTSAVTRGLQVLGVELGGNMMPPAEGNNAKGFWEDVDLNELNIKMLAAIGRDWHNLSPITNGDVDVLREKGYFLRAVELLRQKTGNTALFGFKDPRVAKLLPFWKAIFEYCQIEVSYVLAMRHPLSVAKSLIQRNGLHAEKCYLLWLEHVLVSLKGSAGARRVLVDYDLLMRSPEHELGRIAGQFDLTVYQDRLQSYKTEFLDKDLRHTVYQPADLALDNSCPPLVKEMYLALLDAAADRSMLDTADMKKAIEDWSVEFRRMETALILADKLDGQRLSAMQDVTDKASEIASLNLAAMERESELAKFNTMALEFGEEIGRRNKEAQERDDKIANLNQAVRERDDTIENLNQVVWQRDDTIENLNQAVWERDDRIARLNQDVAEYINRLSILEHENADHIRHIQSQANSINEYLCSSSWRVTRPLRSVGHIWRKIRDVQIVIRRRLKQESLAALTLKTLKVLRNGGLGELKARVRQQHYLASQARIAEATGAPEAGQSAAQQPPEAARPLEVDYSVAVPFGFVTKQEAQSGKIAAIVHLYYEDLAVEFRSYLSNVPGDLDVFISTADAFKAAAIECAFAGWEKGQVEVRVVPNRGRDIAPKLVSFGDIYDRYDYVLHMHGKRSKHADVLSPWRHFLLESLVGTPHVVESILYAFEQFPKLGMVSAQHFEPMRHWTNWGGNFPGAQNLAKRMGFSLDERAPLDFPSGSMFWARTAALRPLLEIGLKTEEFDAESNQTDATLAHAVERIFFHACEHAGFQWIKIARPELYAHTMNIIDMPDKAALSAFFEQHIFHLLDPQGVKPRTAMPAPVASDAPELYRQVRMHALGLHVEVDPGTRVAIGLVTYNNDEQELLGAIAAAENSLKAAGLATDGALFLIDNGESTERGIPEDRFVMRLPPCGNLGFGGGHNKLMQAAFDAGYDIYIAINPDGMLHPNAVEAMVQTLQAAHGKALVEALQFPVEHPKPYDTETLDTPWVSGACLAISRQAYEDLGGFDEDFFMYCEDVDLSWRARAHGYALKTCPRALFLHATTNREMSPETLGMIFESGITLARKWGAPDFESWLKNELVLRGKVIPAFNPQKVPEAWRRIADFTHQFSFAQPRW